MATSTFNDENNDKSDRFFSEGYKKRQTDILSAEGMIAHYKSVLKTETEKGRIKFLKERIESEKNKIKKNKDLNDKLKKYEQQLFDIAKKTDEINKKSSDKNFPFIASVVKTLNDELQLLNNAIQSLASSYGYNVGEKKNAKENFMQIKEKCEGLIKSIDKSELEQSPSKDKNINKLRRASLRSSKSYSVNSVFHELNRAKREEEAVEKHSKGEINTNSPAWRESQRLKNILLSDLELQQKTKQEQEIEEKKTDDINAEDKKRSNLSK